jgi:uncharacterized membrane protein
MLSNPYVRALAAGASAGSRTFTAPALTLEAGGSVWAGAAFLAAAGELVADKLPVMPSRLRPGGLIARFVSGAFCGAAVAERNAGTRPLGFVLGALAAGGAAWLGAGWRRFVAERGWPDFPAAIAEDAVAYSLARAANTLND